MAECILSHLNDQAFYDRIRVAAWERAKTFHWSQVLLLACDPPGVRFLRGMERRQILVKLLTGEAAESFCAFLSEEAETQRENCQVYFEYNPTSMI